MFGRRHDANTRRRRIPGDARIEVESVPLPPRSLVIPSNCEIRLSSSRWLGESSGSSCSPRKVDISGDTWTSVGLVLVPHCKGAACRGRGWPKTRNIGAQSCARIFLSSPIVNGSVSTVSEIGCKTLLSAQLIGEVRQEPPALQHPYDFILTQ